MTIQHDAFLTTLIARAKAVDGSESGPLTAERYMVAVIDTVTKPDGSDDLNRVMALRTMLRKVCPDMDQLRSHLLGYINDPSTVAYLDEFYMKKRMAEAENRAMQVPNPVLSAELVLECLLNNPTPTIRKLLDAAAKDPNVIQVQPHVWEQVAQLKKAPEMEQPKEVEEIPKTVQKAPTPTDEAGGDRKAEVQTLIVEVKKIHSALTERIFGQDNAIDLVTSGYFQAGLGALTDPKRFRPSATFLFAGPPGVGKTFMAECFAQALGLPFQRFDMSEYSDKEANIEFCGSDKVYKNGKAGNVTSFVEENPKCVLLFDEIEKAHINVIHLFLQILDAGRLRDNFTDHEIPFKDTILIFTTNAGKNLYEDAENGNFSGVSRKVILKALQKDVDPRTGVPFFPGAICSRFASGNVVMFNHMAAHDLRNIAKREVQRQANNFTREIGIKTTIDERVYTALLFAEGGAADARTVRSRAEAFFNGELYELLRLVNAGKTAGGITALERIEVTVELPEQDPELRTLFEAGDQPEVLVFTDPKTAAQCAKAGGGCIFHQAGTVEDACALLKKQIALVLLDINQGIKGGDGRLNIEDMDSAARDFFRYIRENDRDMPVYLLQTSKHTFDSEEKVSFLRQGVRGVVTMGKSFGAEMDQICSQLHQQQSMNRLAKANKLVSFETAQTLLPKGKTARISLFDFRMSTALDPEDSSSVLSNVSKPNVKFSQVIGADDAKAELQYFVEYLRDPKKYMGTGVRPPKGVLLYGPPGTGKTMLAKAMASESDVTFLTAEGNQFLMKYVGEGPEKVHELFKTARKYAPSILFVDEIDAIGKERSGSEHTHSSEEVLTAFLTEMDGFKNDPTKPVFVLAATNFDVEPGGARSLDPALMRRFDRRVYIDLPDRDDRVRYMQMKVSSHAAFAVTQDKLENLAIRSTGMSLAALESVFELALRSAIRQGGCTVTDEVLDEAFETFNSGEKKNWDISQLERVARHEAGHAVMCWLGGETPSYITVVARANHGGYMQHGDHEGKAIYTRQELLSRIRTSLGGRAAEIVYYGPEDGISTGASGDLSNASNLAQRMLCNYGMSEDFGLAVVDTQAARNGELSGEVRAGVNRILTEQMEIAVADIEAHRETVDRLVEVLLRRNHLTGSEIQTIFEGPM